MSVLNVGCDLAIKSPTKVTVMDSGGRIINRFQFKINGEGFEYFFTKIEENRLNTIRIICEPTSMMWFPLAVAAKKRGHSVYRVKSEKVSDLRKYYKKHTKTDRIDADTLAKIPIVDEDSLYEVELPSAGHTALNRMVRQHEKLTVSISNRKRRIQDLVTFAVPLLLDCFEDPFNLRARLVFKKYFHPVRVKRLGLRRLTSALLKGSDKPMRSGFAEQVFTALMDAYDLYGEQEYLDFDALSDEMAQEIEMLEHEEQLLEMLNDKIYSLYVQLHPSQNLETIPGVGKTLAPVLFAIISNPERFSTTESFRGFTGMIPRRSESGMMEGKGGKMTKAGPPSIRRALFLAADVARQWDPQIAKHYYEQMVVKGNQHVKSICAIATKMASRVFHVLKEDIPYELRDIDGTIITRQQARQTIIENWTVPDDVRKRLRKKK